MWGWEGILTHSVWHNILEFKKPISCFACRVVRGWRVLRWSDLCPQGRRWLNVWAITPAQGWAEGSRDTARPLPLPPGLNTGEATIAMSVPDCQDHTGRQEKNSWGLFHSSSSPPPAPQKSVLNRCIRNPPAFPVIPSKDCFSFLSFFSFFPFFLSLIDFVV